MKRNLRTIRLAPVAAFGGHGLHPAAAMFNRNTTSTPARPSTAKGAAPANGSQLRLAGALLASASAAFNRRLDALSDDCDDLNGSDAASLLNVGVAELLGLDGNAFFPRRHALDSGAQRWSAAELREWADEGFRLGRDTDAPAAERRERLLQSIARDERRRPELGHAEKVAARHRAKLEDAADANYRKNFR